MMMHGYTTNGNDNQPERNLHLWQKLLDTEHQLAPHDAAISTWFNLHRLPIINTIPAVIQHIGDDSILTPGAPIRRTVYFSEDPVADWTCKEVAPPEPKPETLFANRRRRI